MLGPAGARDYIGDVLFPALLAERERLDRVDRWYRSDHEPPHAPRQSSKEYKELSGRSQTPWLGLVVTEVAQAMYVEGYRAASAPENAAPWGYWQGNGMDRRQIPVHRAALAYGLSYLTVLPGTDRLGQEVPVMRGVSPRRMVAFYDDDDDWASYALRVDPAKVDGSPGWNVRMYDEENVYRFTASSEGGALTYVTYDAHEVGVCPVVRFANMLDLEGRADGEVEPFIPVAARVDQTTFDRLVVQRFASWVVRTITGMSLPEDIATAEKMRLKVEDILIAEDTDTKFGSLPATPLDGFISAHEADVRSLAAVTQTPPHHLLGQMANLSAEALAAAESSLSRKVEERKHSFGESWEQAFRLAASVMGDTEAAADTSAQVRWRDMESRSLAQAADALGKLATMLQVPVEMLWEKVPGWTDQDVERAKTLAAQGGSLESLMAELVGSQTPPAP